MSKKTEDAIQGPFSEMLFKQTEPQQNFSWADPRAERERGVGNLGVARVGPTRLGRIG